jgi:hypothetical protein
MSWQENSNDKVRGPGKPNRRALVVAVAALAVAASAVWYCAAFAGDNHSRTEKPGQGDKKNDVNPAKADKPEPKAPGQQGMVHVFDLMEEMLKTMKNPNGPTPEDLNRMMQKTLQKTLEIHNQLGGAVPNAGLNPLAPPGPDRAGYVQQRLGTTLEPASEGLAEQLDLPRGQGQLITQIVPESGAARAGLKTSDILLELNGKPVPRSLADFAGALEGIKSETPLLAVVLRKGAKKEFKDLKLVDAPPAPAGLPGAGVGFPELPKFPDFPQQQAPQGGLPGVGAGFPRLPLLPQGQGFAGAPFGPRAGFAGGARPAGGAR